MFLVGVNGIMFGHQREKEEYVISLDFLPHGYPFDNQPGYKKTPIVQVIGKLNFTLLELVPKKDIFIQVGRGTNFMPHFLCNTII